MTVDLYEWAAPFETGLKEIAERIHRNEATAKAFGLPYDPTADMLEHLRLRDAFHAENLARGGEGSPGCYHFCGCRCRYCPNSIPSA